MTTPIRWGILGCGKIARKFAADLQWVEGAELQAVASRDLRTAQAFQAEYPSHQVHGSYEALAANPSVDVVYVATPHGLHHAHTLLCLRAGKAVLCEKAFALNQRQAREMIQEARDRKVFLMEALWTKFTPNFAKVQQLIGEGKLGKIQSVLIDFGFVPAPPFADRIFDPGLGGGTLLDIGIYNVFMALSVLGRPHQVEAHMKPAPTGVDAQCAVLFTYPDGAMAQLFSSFCSNLATEADICGDLGRLRLTHRFYEPSARIHFYPGRFDTQQILPEEPRLGFGYHYEARHVGECLRQGLTESPVMSHGDSLLLMETLDRVRAAAGIRYPADLV